MANNSYARGIVLTLAHDTIGTGPRLQMLTEDAEANSQCETLFGRWCENIRLAEKLRTMRMAKAVDGEAFAVLASNQTVPNVQLDLRLLEADQVAFDYANISGDDTGIILDAYGNPISYSILRQHPGDNSWSVDQEAELYRASEVIHWFRADRPGQIRGIPELTAALPLFAQLRRYTLAVIAAAEAAADFALVVKTNAPANGVADELEAMDTIQFEKRMATVLPGGWDLGQAKAEQPTTTYADFKKEILCEIARCLLVPRNVAAGDSSNFNYASGRLDWQTYHKAIRVEQGHLASAVLDPIFSAWLREAVLTEGYLPSALRTSKPLPHEWTFDGAEHVDPLKEANAQQVRLSTGTTTLAREASRAGMDWEDMEAQRARELRTRLDHLVSTVGLTREQALAVVFPAAQVATPAPAPVEKEEVEDEA
jgi:lambda family phage portal protein